MKFKDLLQDLKNRVHPLLGRPAACLACLAIGKRHMQRPALSFWNPSRYAAWECKKCGAVLDRHGRPLEGFLCSRCNKHTRHLVRPIFMRLEWNKRLFVERQCERCGFTTAEIAVA